jgi:hypothetical protein
MTASVERDGFGIVHIANSDGYNADVVSLSETEAIDLARTILSLVTSPCCSHGISGHRCDDCYAALLLDGKQTSENGQQVSRSAA